MLAPMQVRGKSREEAKEKAMRLLKRVGLENKANAMPDELSGGQQQRGCHRPCFGNESPYSSLR